jgi:hypothetical protein
MWTMSVARLLAPLLCTLALVVAGCGASDSTTPKSSTDSPESPKTDSPAGVYRLESVIAKSTIPANKPGKKSVLKADLFLTCGDTPSEAQTPCAALFQRAATYQAQGRTVRLAPSGEGYSGSHARTGKCPKGGGGFRESFAWDWIRLDDGALDGTMQQVFKGCGLDGTTEYEVAATPQPKGRLPYLADADAAAVAADLTTYDATVASVYDGHAKCQAIGDGTPRSDRCFGALYRDWEPDVRTLASAIEGPSGSARSLCRTATETLELTALADALAAAATGYTVEKRNKAISLAGEEHNTLTGVSLMCVPPEDYATLGEDGKLAFDVEGMVTPGAD